jgi:hypothetical protein
VVDGPINVRIDGAYRAKYARTYVGGIVGALARSATLKVTLR